MEKRIYRIVAGAAGGSVTSPSLQPPPFTPSQSWYYKNRFGNVGLQRLCLGLCVRVLWAACGCCPAENCVYITEYNRNVIPLAIVSPHHMVGTPYHLPRAPRIVVVVVVVIITPTDTPRDPPPSSSPNLSSFPLCHDYCARVCVYLSVLYIFIYNTHVHTYTLIYIICYHPRRLRRCSVPLARVYTSIRCKADSVDNRPISSSHRVTLLYTYIYICIRVVRSRRVQMDIIIAAVAVVANSARQDVVSSTSSFVYYYNITAMLCRQFSPTQTIRIVICKMLQ